MQYKRPPDLCTPDQPLISFLYANEFDNVLLLFLLGKGRVGSI